jgi:hypothetical protein
MQFLGQFIHEGVIGILLTTFGGLAMWPVKKVSKAYKELMEAVNSTKAELVMQRENHLTHIEADGARQVELLGKACDTLEAIHLGQVEMSGYIKASSKF